MSAITQEPAELTTLLAAMDKIGPDALTSCPGWTPPTSPRTFAVTTRRSNSTSPPLRKAALWTELGPGRNESNRSRALDHATLQQRIEDLAVATAEAIGDVLDRRPEAELTWTGRTVRISGFSTPFAARTRSIVGTSLATTKRAASCSPSRICLSTR